MSATDRRTLVTRVPRPERRGAPHLALTAVLIAVAAGGEAHAQLATTASAAPTVDTRWSVSAEALSMWFKKSPTPVPIIADSYADAPDVDVLLGGGSVDTRAHAGFKVTGAYRVDSGLGMELTGFYAGTRSSSRSVSSSGEPGSIDLYLPYYDVSIGQENVAEISHWPDYRGSAQATLSNNFGGAEFNVTWTMPAQQTWRVDLLGGVRFLQLRESYTITTSSPYNPPNPVDVWNTTDAFDARNRFFGVQAGARAAYDSGPWVGGIAAKLALGTMQQRVSVNGSLETNDYNNYGPTQIFPGGYFALPSNSGDHSRNTFAAVPEIALNLGYRLTPQATVYVGYSLLYASDVARPGEQINRNVNPTQAVAYGNDPPAVLVGSAQPTFNFNTTDFWTQSVSVGLSYRF